MPARCTHVDVPAPSGVLVHRADDVTGTMLFVHNLGPDDGDRRPQHASTRRPSPPTTCWPTEEYPDLDKFEAVQVAGYGYRWIRLRRYS